MQKSMGYLPPPALGEEPVLAGALLPLVGAAGAGAPLTGEAAASDPVASLPGIPWKKSHET